MKKLASFCFAFCFMTSSLLARDPWESWKILTISKMSNVSGWCSKDKAILMMNLIKEKKFQTCIEIGVFAGKSLFPIAKALQFNDSGIVYGIDAWDSGEAVKGYASTDPNLNWWKKLNYNNLYNEVVKVININNLNKYCTILKLASRNAEYLFWDETIDFIHFDGNHTDEIMYQDVVSYFSKVKDGGYILLNDPNWLCTHRALVFLLERTDIISPFSSSENYLLLRKNEKRIQKAKSLFKTEPK